MEARVRDLDRHVFPMPLSPGTKLSTHLPNVPVEKLAAWALLLGLGQGLSTFKGREYYVSSFCESGDLLSQWRGYGNQGAGYSIGFRFKGYTFRSDQAHQYQLIKLIYNNVKQQALSDCPIRVPSDVEMG